ncbi:MAG: sigma 54-interacting transcriptional regulator [Bacteroidota bacterium]
MTIQQIKQRYGIIGNSHEINTAVEIAMQVAPTEVTVLIYGENGTGKDIFPNIIHQYSKRKHRKFMAVNTGAIPEGTLDSELFGHKKGSFTSAYEDRKGHFEEVNGGSIFLDEIGEMPLPTQARLLRLLENGEYLRVGSSQVGKTDVRVVAATNRNLVEMIRQGKFREDLYFRLNTVTIVVPPLRERGDDIELLFNYFAQEFGEKYHREPVMLSEDAVDLLYDYRWPGTVRELRNLVEKLSVLVKGDIVGRKVLEDNLLIQDSYLPSIVIRPDGLTGESPRLDGEDRDMMLKLIYDLGKEVSDLKKMFYLMMQDRDQAVPVRTYGNQEFTGSRPSPAYADAYDANEYGEALQPIRPNTPLLEESLSLEKKEKELIIKALTKHHNNRKKAASELGISERTLYRKIKNYDIDL